MIIVTGGAGFIGSNIVKALNHKGINDIIVVDDLKAGEKFKNLASSEIADYIDKDDFIEKINKNESFEKKIEAIFHQGACSTTTEWDGRYMMDTNYNYSKQLLHYAMNRGISFIYASSAAVYGAGQLFKEQRQFEKPLNVYGYSKFLFDQYVRRHCYHATSQIVGLRYFNVYGPNENHKGAMASVAYHLNQQLKTHGEIRLFEGSDGYRDGEQRRDFIHVDDVVSVNLWFLDNEMKSGIFNVGTGRSQTFNDVAQSVLAWHQRGQLSYIPFPEHLKGCYQSFTEADISKLREIGYDKSFLSVENGIKKYLDAME